MSWADWILFSCCILFIILGLEAFLKGLFTEYGVPNLNEKLSYPAPRSTPKVSVLIPARNEEVDIGPCLNSLLRSDYPDFEILVYDDQSTDKTNKIVAAIAKTDPRVRLISGTENPPKGWVGKPHAITQLIKEGKPIGDIFLFTDADTIHSPEGMRRAIFFLLNNELDCLSLWPKQIAKTFWEKVIQGPLLLMLVFNQNPLKSNRSQDPKDAIGYGPYILVRRSCYEEVGGHPSVHSSFIEDLQLVQRLRSRGYKTFFAIGRQVYSVRMYHNRTEIIDGWTRIGYTILGESKFNLIFTLSYLFSITYIPPILLILALFSGENLLVGLGVFQYFFVLFVYGFNKRLVFGYPPHALLKAIGSLWAIYILMRSAYFHLGRRPLHWKNREQVHATPSLEI
jgi:chlorobactene glucosyltransferase